MQIVWFIFKGMMWRILTRLEAGGVNNYASYKPNTKNLIILSSNPKHNFLSFEKSHYSSRLFFSLVKGAVK